MVEAVNSIAHLNVVVLLQIKTKRSKAGSGIFQCEKIMMLEKRCPNAPPPCAVILASKSCISVLSVVMFCLVGAVFVFTPILLVGLSVDLIVC